MDKEGLWGKEEKNKGNSQGGIQVQTIKKGRILSMTISHW